MLTPCEESAYQQQASLPNPVLNVPNRFHLTGQLVGQGNRGPYPCAAVGEKGPWGQSKNLF